MRKVALSWSLLLVCLSWLFPGCVFARPLVYVAKSVSGQVVDADTGQPLEGVIVTINWELTGGMHHYPQGQAHVDETITDAQGKFTFPGWGPKPAAVTAHLYESTPQLLFFKSGYGWAKCVSDLDTYVNTRIPLSSDCDRKTIKLKKFTGSFEEYAKRTGLLDDYYRFAFNAESNCEWKQIPRMLVALHLENKRLTASGVSNASYYLRTIEMKDQNYRLTQKCGSIQEFLRSYLP